jgi:hypothetical protein
MQRGRLRIVSDTAERVGQTAEPTPWTSKPTDGANNWSERRLRRPEWSSAGRSVLVG